MGQTLTKRPKRPKVRVSKTLTGSQSLTGWKARLAIGLPSRVETKAGTVIQRRPTETGLNEAINEP